MNDLARKLNIRRRDILQAENVARRIQRTLIQRKLEPTFAGFHLTRYAGILMLIAELDTTRLGRLEPYASSDLLHQISTNLQGKRVYLSNSTGLRYVVPLSTLRGLPHRVDYPDDAERGKAALGLNYLRRPIAVAWGDLGHLMVAGMTGSGKSMFLRLLVYQALRDGMQLLLADIDQATFPMLAGHDALAAPLATTPAEALELIREALGECDRRAARFRAMPGYPENLDEYNRLAVKAGQEPLPRLLLVLDEFSATLKALGGGRGAAGDLLAAIGFRGRKFGVNVVFAAHEFTKDEVGLLRDQVRTVVMFRVQSKDMARRMGCDGAERVSPSRPGLAVTNRWGPMQAYFLDKGRLIGERRPAGTLDKLAYRVLRHAWAHGDGAVPVSLIEHVGAVSNRRARALQERWAVLGWIRKDSRRKNAYCLTPKAVELLFERSNDQTDQTRSNAIKQPVEAIKR